MGLTRTGSSYFSSCRVVDRHMWEDLRLILAWPDGGRHQKCAYFGFSKTRSTFKDPSRALSMHGELFQGDTSVFWGKTKQLYMHGTLASIEKAAECCPRAFLLSSSSSFELHAVLTLWNMNFRVTCHCFLLLTICYLKKASFEGRIFNLWLGSMLSGVWKDGHFLSSEKNIEGQVTNGLNFPKNFHNFFSEKSHSLGR